MKITFHIQQWPNRYFFIQNLSCWHYSNTSAYNQTWLRQTDKLSPAEQELLKRFAHIHQQHGFDSAYSLYVPFLIKKNPWPALRQIVHAEDYVIVRDCFRHFEPRFQKLYKQARPTLVRWRQHLSQQWHLQPEHHSHIEVVLRKFYHLKNTSLPPVRINLVIGGQAPLSTATAYPSQRSILLPLAQATGTQAPALQAIIWHELIHVYFERSFFLPLILEHVPDHSNVAKIIEMTASSLLPNGILGEKYFDQKNQPHLYSSYPDPIADQRLLTLMNKYVTTQQSLDLTFLQQTCEILKVPYF